MAAVPVGARAALEALLGELESERAALDVVIGYMTRRFGGVSAAGA